MQEESGCATLDELVETMYRSVSFEPEAKPDWESDRKIFTPDARLVRMNDAGAVHFTVDSYIQNVETMIAGGELPSFFETEITRQTRSYGDMAQIWSLYEGRHSRTDPEIVTRGVNSIQAMRIERRWFIHSLIWFRESDAHPLDEAVQLRIAG